jgi:phosphoesterase RecJ-like protein
MGKTAYVLRNQETTEKYLPFIADYWAPEGYVPEHTITVDTASQDLFPDAAKAYSDKISLSIDHHQSNTLYADYTCLDDSTAACAEVVYDILKALPCGVNKTSAGQLYIALSTDTGCFSFANTTAASLKTAAELIELGAPHTALNRMLFRARTRGRVKMESIVNNGLEFYFNDAVAVAAITRDVIKYTGAAEDDVDGIASIPGSIEGVLVGITIRELTSSVDCKVSIRTAPGVSAHDICQRFGGGGHPMAAGFARHASIEKIKRELFSVLGDFLPGD